VFAGLHGARRWPAVSGGRWHCSYQPGTLAQPSNPTAGPLAFAVSFPAEPGWQHRSLRIGSAVPVLRRSCVRHLRFRQCVVCIRCRERRRGASGDGVHVSTVFLRRATAIFSSRESRKPRSLETDIRLTPADGPAASSQSISIRAKPKRSLPEERLQLPHFLSCASVLPSGENSAPQPPASLSARHHNSSEQTGSSNRIVSTLRDNQRDVVVLFMRTECPNLIDNRPDHVLRRQVPMPPQRFDQA
jgi:hypothetical protein